MLKEEKLKNKLMNIQKIFNTNIICILGISKKGNIKILNAYRKDTFKDDSDDNDIEQIPKEFLNGKNIINKQEKLKLNNYIG